MKAESTALTTTESSNLQSCERVIEKGLNTFREVGQALIEIRDSKLYRSAHATFADYCEKRWGFSDSRARQLISAAKVAETVTNVTLPNEGAARALNSVPVEQQQAVVDWATEKAEGTPLTARAIKEAAAEVADSESEEDEDDEPPVKSGKAKPKESPEPSGGGKQKSDPRAFTRLESQLGACLRAIDALNRQTPASKFHRDAIAGVKTAMTAVTEWQRATR
jgi:hypothetical protein